MANTLYRYLPLGLGEDREKDRRFACGRWPLGRIVSLVLVGFVALLLLFNSSGHTTFRPQQRWVEYENNPVLPDVEHSESIGTVFDLGLFQENMTITGIPADLYYSRNPDAAPIETEMRWRMWNSWRPKYSIGYSTSVDGKIWDQNITIALQKDDSSKWDGIANRPFVLKVATGKYKMWYTGQHGGAVGGALGYAESQDGITFKDVQTEPVMVQDIPWENECVMTPSVLMMENGVLRMYYSAGQAYEPDSIGVAHSYDGGRTWVKHGNAIFGPDRHSGAVGEWWDSHKTTSPHVLLIDEWYYMFYAGFRNTDYSSIGLARSKDGLTNWQKHSGNPIIDISTEKDAWNCNAVYKPYAGWDEEQQQWMVWYNGRCGGLERIGVSFLKEEKFHQFEERG